MEAEAAWEAYLRKFGDVFMELMGRRSSYGYFPEIGAFHMHLWQTSDGDDVLASLGLSQWSIRNFQRAL
jgi:hypothetical protein